MTSKQAEKIKQFKAQGFIPLKDAGTYAARLHVVAGNLTADQLATVAQLSNEYGWGTIHMTTRQGIEIQGIAEKDIPAFTQALQQAGLRTGGSGPRIRTVVACPGIACCNGVIETQQLAETIYQRLSPKILPHKFKLSIAGCPNGCAKPQATDLGIQGTRNVAVDNAQCVGCGKCAAVCPAAGTITVENKQVTHRKSSCIGCGKCVAACPTNAWAISSRAYQVYVGGKMGRQFQLGTKLPIAIDSEQQLLSVVEAIVEWYIAHGRAKERLADTLARTGHTHLNDFLSQ